MALSGDASCNGLYSAREGQTLQLKEGKVRVSEYFQILIQPNLIVSSKSKCSLPSWIESGKVWQSLDKKLRLEIEQDQVTKTLLRTF